MARASDSSAAGKAPLPTRLLTNRRLQPRLLYLGLNICGLEEEDLFYFKDRSRVDWLAVSFRETADQLANLPSL